MPEQQNIENSDLASKDHVHLNSCYYQRFLSLQDKLLLRINVPVQMQVGGFIKDRLIDCMS